MFWNILFGVVTAVLAVFGFVCAARALLDWAFPVRQITVAVEIRNREDADQLEMLLHEARSAAFGKGGAHLTVLLSSSLTENDEIPDRIGKVLDRYRAECYLIDP